MSKAHRGKGIRDQVKNGRGLCPQCKIENIKVLYEHEVDGQKVKVCKFCNATIKNKKKAEAPVAAPAPAEVKAPVEVAEKPAAVVETPAEVKAPVEVAETPAAVVETPAEVTETAKTDDVAEVTEAAKTDDVAETEAPKVAEVEAPAETEESAK